MVGEDRRYVETSERLAYQLGKFEQACHDFHYRIDSETMFRARLFAIGYRGRDIDVEVRLHAPPVVCVPPPKYLVHGGTVTLNPEYRGHW